MSESTKQDESQPTKRHFLIQKIYVKDISFETPNSPKIFTEEWKPEVNLQLGNAAVVLNEGIHEVTLSLTVTTKVGEKIAYLAEVQQAGIFNITGYDKKDLSAMVGSYCPNILFPFAREVVSDIVTKGGFPQLLLSPVNFEGLYKEYMQQAENQAAKAKATH